MTTTDADLSALYEASLRAERKIAKWTEKARKADKAFLVALLADPRTPWSRAVEDAKDIPSLRDVRVTRYGSSEEPRFAVTQESSARGAYLATYIQPDGTPSFDYWGW